MKAVFQGFVILVVPPGPAERVMALALRTWGESTTGFPVIEGWCTPSGHHEHPRSSTAWDQVALCQQHLLGDYRADFFLTGYHENSPVRSVVVEVDGHEFHERTKEQARHDRSRDRAVQRRGHKVLRFTGSEVYADPFRCAQEAIEAALGVDSPETGA